MLCDIDDLLTAESIIVRKIRPARRTTIASREAGIAWPWGCRLVCACLPHERCRRERRVTSLGRVVMLLLPLLLLLPLMVT